MGKTLREPAIITKEAGALYIEALLTTLQEFHIPEGFCSVGEYAEEAVCLEKNASSWIVYEGERGKKYNIKTHMNCRDACCDIISRISESAENEKELKHFFHLECENMRFNRLGYTDIKKTNSTSDIVPILGTEEYKKRTNSSIH